MTMKQHQHVETLDSCYVSAPEAAAEDVLWAGLDRAEMRKQFAAGELQELEFEAVVFQTVYPNWNYVRFRREEMDAFAGSFAGVPFLRNHDMQDIAARDGIVTACSMDGDAMHARIKLTTEEGIRDFLAGRIDRFSISWFKHGATLCSVCGKDIFGPDCHHVPGRTYAVNPARNQETRNRAFKQACGNQAPHAKNSVSDLVCEMVQIPAPRP